MLFTVSVWPAGVGLSSAMVAKKQGVSSFSITCAGAEYPRDVAVD
ncbi:hypothetical protein CFter6_1845 [Collimonas fungivorans]|uniref:Uncharacterized protein n=1 Tax=Collimonas fungivorans TaxID=158899 RepID=A0A127P9P5_9BURK|nr:hypothetical protein CFter6_1845 [Collimonas fungivorans]